jgi:hypothetical protein
MRMIALAAALFAAGFGVVAIGQKAFGLYRPHQFSAATSSAHRPATEPSKAKVYSDYLNEAQAAYEEMNLTCSTAHRKAFGRSFHQLVAATRALRAGVIDPGDLRPAAVSDLIGASPDALLVDAAMSGELAVFAEAFDATKRGVLTDADLPPGLTTLMQSQLTNARADAGRNTDPLAAMKVKLPTYCQPL